MTKEKRKVVGWIGKIVVIRDLLHCWVLEPDPLAPGVDVVVVSLLVDVIVDLTDHYHSWRQLFEPRCPQALRAGSGLGAGG